MPRKRAKAVFSDVGTPERARHGRYVTDKAATEDTTTRDRRRYIHDDPLRHYTKTRVITARQRDAGFELRELWHRIGLQGSVITNYGEYIAKGSVDALKISSFDHYKRFRHALESIRTKPEERAVIRVCCFEEALIRGEGLLLESGLERLRWHFRIPL